MLTVYNCLVTEHDLRLVALAAVICALASYTAISLLHHVRKSAADMWRAMLAFSPGVPTAYNITLTGMSLVAAIFLTGIGLAVAVASMAGPRWSAWLGGALVGGGIAAMHYTGMAAFAIMGRIMRDPLPVAR